MTSPLGDVNTNVTMTATATFAQLIAEAKKAERAIDDVRRAEDRLNKDSVKGSNAFVKAAKDRADAIRSQADASRRGITANENYAKSFEKVSSKISALRKDYKDLENVAKTFTANNNKLADSFERLNRSQSGGSGFAKNTQAEIDQASNALKKFENQLRAVYAASQGETIDLRVDSESALNEIAKIAAEVQILTRGVNEVEIRINANRTLIEARSLAQAIKREFRDVIDADDLAGSQERFREIARDIAADAAEFRREQQRLDMELLEDQIELQNRFRDPADTNTDRSASRADSTLLDQLGGFLKENSDNFKAVADSFESSISDLTDSLKDLKGSDGTEDLSQSLNQASDEAERASEELGVLNRRIAELESREKSLAEEQSKNTAQAISNEDKLRRARKLSDIDDLAGKALKDEASRLNIKGRSSMLRDQLREAIKAKYLEPTAEDTQKENTRRRLQEEQQAAKLELDAARLAAKEKLIAAQAAAKQQEILIKAQADKEREADRLNSKLTILQLENAERIRAEAVKQQIEDIRRVAREREAAEKQTDAVLREFAKNRIRESVDEIKRQFQEIQRRAREAASAKPVRGTRANLLRTDPEERTEVEKDTLAALKRLTIAKREVNEAVRKSQEAQDVLAREIAVADDIETRIRSGQTVDRNEIDEHKEQLAIARQEVKETEQLLNQVTRARERNEQQIVALVTRSEREKSSVRKRAARDAERDAQRVQKELERIANLPIGDRLGLFARNVARDMVLLFRESRKTEDRFSSFGKSFALLRREVGKGLKIEGGDNFGSNLVRVFRQVGDASGNLLKSLTKVRGEIFRMPGVIFLLVSSLGGLIAGLGAAGAGFLGFANAVTSALGILASAPGIFTAVAAAAGALTLGTSGIGDALKAASDVNEKKAEAKASGSDKDDSVTKARQLRSATRGYEDALDSLSDAQKDQKKAQQDIAKAWREAKEDLIDLQFTVRQGVIDEERAILNLRKARLELAKIQAGGTEDPEKAREALLKLQEARKEYNKVLLDGNSNAIERAKALRKVNEAEIAYAEATRKRATRDDRKGAELDVRDAELALEKIRERNKRDQRDLNKLQDEGLGKSDKVVAANERLADANDRVADAQEAVAEAALRLKEVQQDTAKNGTDAAAKSADKLKAILDKMSPSQRKFTEYLIGMVPKFEQLKRTLAEEIFRPVADDLSLLNDVLALTGDFLRPTATAIGLLFEQGLKLITSGPFRRDFKTIGKDSADVIKSLGEAALDVVTAFKDIIVASGDFTKNIAAALGSSAEEFRDWAAKVRKNGSLKEFLRNAEEDLGVFNKIFRNLGATFVSYFKATEEQGDYILERIRLMTEGWRKVAKAQEAANSPLKKFLEDSRPALSALTSLFGAVGKAIAGIASRPENLEAAIDLFEALEEDVLPPLVDIINTLSDTGLAAGIVSTIGEILKAISAILDNGGALALVVYAKAVSLVVTAIAKFAALPGVSHIIGGIAIALAGIAAAATVTKFLGLLKLLEFFQWVNKNGKGVADKLNNIGDGVDKSTKNNSSSKNSKTDKPTLDDAFDDFDDATDKVDKLDKKMDKAKGTAGKLKGAFGKLGDALGSGGFAGLGVAAAILAFEFIAGKVQESDTKVENLKDSLLDAAGAFKEAGPAGLNAVSDIVKNNEQLAETIILLDKASKGGKGGPTPTDLLKGIGGDFEAYRRVVDDLNAQIALYDKSEKDGGKRNFLGLLDADEATQRASLVERRKAIRAAWMEAEKQREADKALADAQPGLAGAIDGATGAQKNFNFQSNKAKEEMRELAEQQVVYSEAIKVINDPLATVEERTQALADINKILYGRQKSIIEQNDEYEGQLLNLKEAVDQNGTSLKNTTREGQNNREMLKTAATAAKNFYEQDIAAKVPQQEANKRYQERIENLKELAKKLKLNEEETKNLIAAYGGIETNINTVISMTGDDDVKRALLELAALQLSLKNPNLTPSQARDIVNKDLALERQAQDRAAARKPATKKAYGGFVSGPGGPRDDQIPAWLSNEEFVQPADATKHYGVPFMEKLRRKQIPKQAVQKIEGMGFSTGGHVGCEMCASGQAHAQKYATGGMVKWPFKVDVSKSKTDFDVAAAENPPGSFTGSVGSGKPGSGYQWLINIARKIDPNARVISTVRPGDRTLSGARSLHADGKAVDFSPSRKLAEGLYSQYGKQMKELITPWRDLMLYYGKPAKFNRAIEAQHGVFGQNAHVHAGTYASGGLVRNPFDFGALKNRVAPVSTPRALSQAARDVITNSSENKEVNYNVTVNNPLQERAGDSIRGSLARTVYLNESV